MKIELDYVKVGDYLLPQPSAGAAANDLLNSMRPGMAKEAGAIEALKARHPMRWVGLMNCCKAQVEEIIFAELIFC